METKQKMNVKDKVALITGGVSGIGLNFAKELLRNGLKGVSLVDINEEAAQEVIPLIEQEFGQYKAIFIKTDVTNKTEFEDAFKNTVEIFKNIDIVINSAGIVDERNFERMINVNLIAALLGTYLAMDIYLPKYRSSEEESVVINVSSIYGLDGCQYGVGYTAAKHAVVGVSKCLGTEFHYRETGVKILTLCPGYTDTPLPKNVADKIKLGRYYNLFNDASSQISFQKCEVISKALIQILKKFETGEIWVIDDGECYEVEIPSRFALKKKNVLKI